MEEIVINTIVRVLSAEEQASHLTAPPGVGKRPYLMNADLPARKLHSVSLFNIGYYTTL